MAKKKSTKKAAKKKSTKKATRSKKIAEKKSTKKASKAKKAAKKSTKKAAAKKKTASAAGTKTARKRKAVARTTGAKGKSDQKTKKKKKSTVTTTTRTATKKAQKKKPQKSPGTAKKSAAKTTKKTSVAKTKSASTKATKKKAAKSSVAVKREPAPKGVVASRTVPPHRQETAETSAQPATRPALSIVPANATPLRRRGRYTRRSSPMGKKKKEVVFEGPPPVITPEVPDLPVKHKGTTPGAKRPSVLDANIEFYRALQERDIGHMARLWAHDGTVRCTHPNGVLLRGWVEVRNGFEQIFGVDRPSAVELTQVYAEQSGDIAFVSLVERVAMPQSSRPRTEHPATNIFRWDGERWLVIAHHST